MTFYVEFSVSFPNLKRYFDETDTHREAMTKYLLLKEITWLFTATRSAVARLLTPGGGHGATSLGRRGAVLATFPSEDIRSIFRVYCAGRPAVR